MSEHFSDRTIMMLGDRGYARLRGARVAIFGIGGVGGYAVEALARAGVGSLDLIDSDRVSVSNINRQIIATESTVGKYKTEAAKDRIASINPECRVTTHNVFFSEETLDNFDFDSYDYILDAIDSVSSKVELISAANSHGVPIISAMGAGNKLDPTKFKVSDISKTAVCPLAKAVRIALRKRGINHLKVVYSEEEPIRVPDNRGIGDRVNNNSTDTLSAKDSYDKRRAPGSISFVPSVMGLILAGEIIKDISGIREQKNEN